MTDVTGATVSITLKISLGRSSRVFLVLTNETKVGNRFMKASYKILSSHWSSQIEELVWTLYEESNAVSVFLFSSPVQTILNMTEAKVNKILRNVYM